jgi:hypothetical protein
MQNQKKYSISLAIVLSILWSFSVLAQPGKNVKNAKVKQTTILLPTLNAKLVLDTTRIVFYEKKDAALKFVYLSDPDSGWGFKMTFDKDDILSLNDFKELYKPEQITEIDATSYIETHSDSATFTLNNLSYWFEQETFRKVPAFWADVKQNKKLSNKDMVTYLNSDRESWEKSENHLLYYTVNKPTHELVKITLTYFYDEASFINQMEKKAKEILAGFSFTNPPKKK